MVLSPSFTRTIREVASTLLIVGMVTGCATDDAVTEGVPDIPWSDSSIGRAVGPSFTFRAGDTLELYVLEDSSLDGEYPVRQTGDVIIPRLGRVSAVGKTTQSIESEIKRRLEQNQINVYLVI